MYLAKKIAEVHYSILIIIHLIMSKKSASDEPFHFDSLL